MTPKTTPSQIKPVQVDISGNPPPLDPPSRRAAEESREAQEVGHGNEGEHEADLMRWEDDGGRILDKSNSS
jgi:hypothetical protein